MSQDKTNENPGKKESIEQPSNNMCFIQKFEFLIKWQIFPHSESNWEPEEISLICRSLNLISK